MIIIRAESPWKFRVESVPVINMVDYWATLQSFECSPLLYIMGLEGQLEITALLNVRTAKFNISGMTITFLLTVYISQP
jgi:hypothetical protein